jgi:hypothetical protein
LFKRPASVGAASCLASCFLLSDAIRPYQHAVFSQIGLVGGLNFEGEHHRFARRGSGAMKRSFPQARAS